MKPDWGSVPDWIAGVGGMLAFGAVVASLLIERRRTEEARRYVLESDRRAQAERITYYLVENPGPSAAVVDGRHERTPVDGGNFFYGPGDDERSGHLVVVNNSHGCVYACIAYAPEGPEGMPDRAIGVIPPGVTHIRMPLGGYPVGGSGSYRYQGEYANNKLVPWIQFRDEAGHTWRRGNDGALLEPRDPNPFPDHSP
ncbi:hypothetical protein BJ973_002057 [Actinoplanes tereljensis]|uniref:Uncharacterized protein n=1 Tax=Paractinoplanes tereljensis TaxID=571912 RepID=A0A919NKW1_9ACTN|nr:hypothetical protein [Actinoplanes tereljensis]GIF20038.1 hypothetical protein Ate02nite_27680 [Actinoplanes tereljensis]